MPSDEEDGSFLRVSVLNSFPCVSAYPVFESVLSYNSHTKATPGKRDQRKLIWPRVREASIQRRSKDVRPWNFNFQAVLPGMLSSRVLRIQTTYSIRVQVLLVGDLCPRTDRGGRVKSPSAMEPPNDPEELQQGFTNQAHWPHSNPPPKG